MVRRRQGKFRWPEQDEVHQPYLGYPQHRGKAWGQTREFLCKHLGRLHVFLTLPYRQDAPRLYYQDQKTVA
jgi:hypothetical protein